jgi:ribosome-associated protein
MNISQLQLAVVDALEDVKAQEIQVFDSTRITELFDRVVVASGTSNRQTRALAMSVSEKVRDLGGEVLAIEGLETGEWVLVDCGDLVCHIMQPAIRSYYNLEELWGQVSVDWKTEPKKGAAKKSATAKKSAAVKKPSGAKKTATAKKSAAIKPTSAKKTPATEMKAPAAKKPAAKKTAAKKSPARKTVTKKTQAD